MLKLFFLSAVVIVSCSNVKGAPSKNGVDWRQQGVVSPVGNQMSALESHFAIKSGKLEKLSLQNLVDCALPQSPGCSGGIENLESYAEYLSTVGVDTEACYPTTGKQSTCQFNASCSVGKIKGINKIEPSEASLTKAIDTAPVIVHVDASQTSFQLYTHGVYSDAACSASNLDHAMVADGYGEEDGQKFYLLQNSWGPNWGLGGYMLMSRDKGNNCGIATDAYAIS